jgi:hypothetical protein
MLMIRRLLIKVILIAVIGGFLASYVSSHHSASAATGSSAGIGTVPVTSSTSAAFIKAVLADLGAPASRADIGSLASWFPHEGTAAAYNPMASTLREPGSTTFNYDGVQNYVSAAQGAHATADTLANGLYPGIVAALRSGRGLCGNLNLAAEFLRWSGGGYSRVC